MSEVITPHIRRATVVVMPHHHAPDRLREVLAYMPSNYTARIDGSQIIIEGVDMAGWTLDGYVIPRLASGLITAKEVTS
jgi:hypothetical protein